MIRLSPFLISRNFFYYSDTQNNRTLKSEIIGYSDKYRLATNRFIASSKIALAPQSLYKKFIEPRCVGDQDRHREFIVNVLLSGLATITILKLLLSISTDFKLGLDQEERSLLINSVFLLLVLFIWHMSRRGRVRFTAYYLLGLLCLEAIRMTLNWSFELPAAELMYAVVIVTAGIILKVRSALIVTGITSLVLLGVSYAQIAGYLRPHTYWVQKDFQMSDTFGYIAILCVIALVTWLSSHEISNSLARALASEATLAKERDNLEVQVAERTRELFESQLLRNVELERFAEFGRICATMIHDVASPLTAASLNLELYDGSESRTVLRARKNLQQLERYVCAARQQLKSHGKLETFSVNNEFKRLSLVMEPIASKNGVRINFESNGNYQLFGDPVKFNQLLANLISNAIDAYEGVTINGVQKTIQIEIKATLKYLRLMVTDWGKGIPPEAMPWVFEPFYTTKSDSDRGTGIGLTMVKRVVEEDFSGYIKVTSAPSDGTRFAIKLRR